MKLTKGIFTLSRPQLFTVHCFLSFFLFSSFIIAQCKESIKDNAACTTYLIVVRPSVTASTTPADAMTEAD